MASHVCNVDYVYLTHNLAGIIFMKDGDMSIYIKVMKIYINDEITKNIAWMYFKEEVVIKFILLLWLVDLSI